VRLDRASFEQVVRDAVASIPSSFRRYLDGLVVDVEDEPAAELLAEMEMDDPTELLGLYTGTPWTERSVEEPVGLPDHVIIYQRNLERMCETRDELLAEVQRTVLHEVGHHFGLDEENLEEFGYE